MQKPNPHPPRQTTETPQQDTIRETVVSKVLSAPLRYSRWAIALPSGKGKVAAFAGPFFGLMILVGMVSSKTSPVVSTSEIPTKSVEVPIAEQTAEPSPSVEPEPAITAEPAEIATPAEEIAVPKSEKELFTDTLVSSTPGVGAQEQIAILAPGFYESNSEMWLAVEGIPISEAEGIVAEMLTEVAYKNGFDHWDEKLISNMATGVVKGLYQWNSGG